MSYPRGMGIRISVDDLLNGTGDWANLQVRFYVEDWPRKMPSTALITPYSLAAGGAKNVQGLDRRHRKGSRDPDADGEYRGVAPAESGGQGRQLDPGGG
eukprot:4976416-Prorocentrum_lima.AAC.1